jgi:hypothetical protein
MHRRMLMFAALAAVVMISGLTAQAQQLYESNESGSVLVLPKFVSGTVATGVPKDMTSAKCILLLVSLCQTLHDRPVLVLAGVQASLSYFDSVQTVDWLKTQGYKESDPLARPFVHNPAALYALDGAGAIGTAWLAHRMRTSHNRWAHRLWWMPQTVVISGNAWALGYTATHARKH